MTWKNDLGGIKSKKKFFPPKILFSKITKGPTASLGDFQNPCFLGGNSRKVHENFLEKKKSPLHPKAFLQYLQSLLLPRKIRKKIFIETFLWVPLNKKVYIIQKHFFPKKKKSIVFKSIGFK